MTYNLAFSGSGFLFPAHVGAYNKIIAKYKSTPLAVAGTSGGSIIAAMIAIGMSYEDIKILCRSLKIDDLLEWNPAAIFRNGVCNGKKIELLLKSVFKDKTMSSTVKPLFVTASDIDDGDPVIFDSVNTPDVPIWFAVRASCTIPLVITPIKWNDKLLVDGALYNNMPSNLFNDDKPVVGVHLIADVGKQDFFSKTRSPISYSVRIATLMFDSILNNSRYNPGDIIYPVDLAGYSYLGDYSYEELLYIGESAIK